MNRDTIVIYEIILEAVNIANNALIAVRSGDTSTALSDLSNARRRLETARDSLRRLPLGRESLQEDGNFVEAGGNLELQK